jgi:hypothetical protein
MEMAVEAGWDAHHAEFDPRIERFAELVREDATAEANARANASWTLMCEKMVADEREACAKVCDDMEEKAEGTECCKWPTPIDCAAAIRARGQA